MDAASPSTTKRRTVRDFSRRNFVLFYLLLLMVPTIYLVWYLIGTASGSIVPSPDLKLEVSSTSGGQMAVYTQILTSLWKAAFKMVPYSIGQYLLGLPCEIDQNFVWASGSLLSLVILSLVEIFDVLLNTELGGGGKTVWGLAMLVFGALGAPIPQLIYWFQYMWMEPDRSATGAAAGGTPPAS